MINKSIDSLDSSSQAIGSINIFIFKIGLFIIFLFLEIISYLYIYRGERYTRIHSGNLHPIRMTQ